MLEPPKRSIFSLYEDSESDVEKDYDYEQHADPAILETIVESLPSSDVDLGAEENEPLTPSSPLDHDFSELKLDKNLKSGTDSFKKESVSNSRQLVADVNSKGSVKSSQSKPTTQDPKSSSSSSKSPNNEDSSSEPTSRDSEPASKILVSNTDLKVNSQQESNITSPPLTSQTQTPKTATTTTINDNENNTTNTKTHESQNTSTNNSNYNTKPTRPGMFRRISSRILMSSYHRTKSTSAMGKLNSPETAVKLEETLTNTSDPAKYDQSASNSGQPVSNNKRNTSLPRSSSWIARLPKLLSRHPAEETGPVAERMILNMNVSRPQPSLHEFDNMSLKSVTFRNEDLVEINPIPQAAPRRVIGPTGETELRKRVIPRTKSKLKIAAQGSANGLVSIRSSSSLLNLRGYKDMKKAIGSGDLQVIYEQCARARGAPPIQEFKALLKDKQVNSEPFLFSFANIKIESVAQAYGIGDFLSVTSVGKLIKGLDLTNCGLDAKKLNVILAGAFRHSQIESLSVAENVDIGFKGIKYVLYCIHMYRTVRMVDFSGLTFNAKTAQLISKTLLHGTSVDEFRFHNCQIL